jgi:hypothetical protein
MADAYGTQDKSDSAEFHDRLDLKLGTEHYTDAPCGSVHSGTGEPAYCCAKCPTLKAAILADAQKA